VSEADRVRVSTLVQVAPAVAFEVFTSEVDAWWKHGPRFRAGGDRPSSMSFEAGIGGRLLETYQDAQGGCFELGRVTDWKPAERLPFQMGGRDLGADEWTEVEIRFESEGEGTRVTLEHRGFEALGADHPVRHGLADEAFRDVMSIFWADLLTAHGRRVRELR
jgi:hypothetical protein